MKIVVLDGYTLNPGDLSWDELKNLGDITIYDRTAPGKVVERSKGAEIILTNKTIITAKIIADLPELKFIGVLATGYNVVDMEAARERKIIVTNIPAYATPSVSQLVFAHILNIAQRVQHYGDEVREGKWTNSPDFTFIDTPLIELYGKKMGIIGLGNIGYSTARIAVSFGMEVWVYTSKNKLQLPPEFRKKELDEIFTECDIVSLHCPLTKETTGMINSERLSMMKNTAILINTGRGGLVNEHDLANALNNHQIFAAGLDVLTTEPPSTDNPLLKIKNCYITPHIAWSTLSARRRLMDIMVNNIRTYQEGKPENVVNN